MGRECSECGYFCNSGSFSSNQWRKGPGYSRCKSCVDGYCYRCHTCGRSFASSNELKMHSQVHRPRNVACPVCGERRFRSGANAVQHVESGFCRGCRGRDNAREQIWKFASRKAPMRRYLTDVPMLEYGYDDDDYGVPDFPYQCPDCNRSFRQLSQLMQHRDQKHNNFLALTNY